MTLSYVSLQSAPTHCFVEEVPYNITKRVILALLQATCENEVAWEWGYSHELPVKVVNLWYVLGRPPMRCLTIVWKRCRDGALPICWPLLLCIIPTLFAYFVACHPYIFFTFFVKSLQYLYVHIPSLWYRMLGLLTRFISFTFIFSFTFITTFSTYTMTCTKI